jgi:hypothetical protein
MIAIQQTVEIPASRRLIIDVPPEVPAGPVMLTFTPVANSFVPAEAEKTWAWNRAHSREVQFRLRKLQGSLSSASFGGMDGVSYQRKVRDEWDVD